MLEQIKMPSFGATMESGTIIAWKVKEGDAVNAGDVILEMESDKATFDFESPCSGTVRKLLADNGATVPVQNIIAIIGDANEQIPAEWLQESQNEKPNAVTQLEPEKASHEQNISSTADSSRGVKISPKAKKLAASLGIDITKVKGTGPGGRIESSDIEELK